MKHITTIIYKPKHHSYNLSIKSIEHQALFTPRTIS